MKVIKLYKNGCVPCTQVTDFLNREAIEHESFDAFNEGAEIAMKEGIMSVPYLMLVDDKGNTVFSVKGFNESELQKFKQQYTQLKGDTCQ